MTQVNTVSTSGLIASCPPSAVLLQKQRHDLLRPPSAGGEVERRAHLDQARAIIQRAARRAREVDVLLLLLTIHLI